MPPIGASLSPEVALDLDFLLPQLCLDPRLLGHVSFRKITRFRTKSFFLGHEALLAGVGSKRASADRPRPDERRPEVDPSAPARVNLSRLDRIDGTVVPTSPKLKHGNGGTDVRQG